MAHKKIREFDAKKIIAKELNFNFTSILVDANTDLNSIQIQGPLVVKPDQCFGQRKKHGLVKVNISLNQAKEFIQENMNKKITIGKAIDKLTHFLIEPFIAHEKEYYLSIKSERKYDIINFSETGGVDIEDNWNQVKKIQIPTLENLDETKLNQLSQILEIKQFIRNLFNLFRKLDFSYLEINPFTIVDDNSNSNNIHMLDTVAQIDSCASFKNLLNLEFPKDFGKILFAQEKVIEELDKKSGASLKLTILNPNGKIWNILGGGGASIIYLDMITNLGKGEEIANYGEASGNPSKEESYEYAKAIIDLMLQNKGEILFIVGGIANFTDVKDTFKGYAQALEEYSHQLKENNIKIFVRRGGPNYQAGLDLIKTTGEKLGIKIETHGPETSMPKIIQIAGDSL